MNKNLSYYFGIILIVIGSFSLIYYLILLGFSNTISFSTFWLVIGLFLLIFGISITKYKNKLWIKIPRTLRKILIVFIILSTTIFISIEISIIYHGNKKEASVPSYIVVLGAGLNKDKISTSLYYRLNSAIELSNQIKDVPIIVSGGQGENESLSEAKAMKLYLISKGVNEARIIMEDKSTNTYENFKFTKEKILEIFNDTHPTITIITNNFHMYRSKIISENLGFKVYEYSSPSYTTFNPNFYAREFFAVVKVLVYGK